MQRSIFSCLCSLAIFFAALAADPMATNFSFSQCEGSLTPYPTQIAPVEYPDSLQPVFINHVGRHGSRYPASAAHSLALRTALMRADSLGTITPLGKQLLELTQKVITLSDKRWGALDSLGEAEQRVIASRMYLNFAPVFKDAVVKSISSYSPRSMMSMYCFTHQLDRLNNHIEFVTSTGRENSLLLRPFDTDRDYIEFRDAKAWSAPYDEYFEKFCPVTAIGRVLGKNYPYSDDAQARELAITEYYVIAGLSAMSVSCDASKYFTKEEANALWSCFNLRQYLQRTATTVSTVPADIAAALLMDIINTTDSWIDGAAPAAVYLRFGHAETLLPLLSLIHLSGCYYMTNYFDTVAQHWQDFNIVPMAANLQMILFKNPKSGRYYLRTDLNEKPTPLIPNNPSIYVPWADARAYLLRCVPLYAQ